MGASYPEAAAHGRSFEPTQQPLIVNAEVLQAFVAAVWPEKQPVVQEILGDRRAAVIAPYWLPAVNQARM